MLKKEKIDNPPVFETLTVDTNFNSNKETELWVEKFKPKDYFELLSDDVNQISIRFYGKKKQNI